MSQIQLITYFLALISFIIGFTYYLIGAFSGVSAPVSIDKSTTANRNNLRIMHKKVRRGLRNLGIWLATSFFLLILGGYSNAYSSANEMFFDSEQLIGSIFSTLVSSILVWALIMFFAYLCVSSVFVMAKAHDT